MAPAQAALLESDEVKAQITDVLTGVVTAALLAKGIPVPPFIVREVVARAVKHVGSLNPNDLVRYSVRALVRTSPVAATAQHLLGRNFEDEAAQILEGKMVEAGLPVPEGEPDDFEPCEVDCPVTGDTITLEDDDGEYTCPDCGLDIEVTDGAAEHEDVPEVTCPESEEVIQLTDRDGTYRCPDCRQDVVVEDGIAFHALEVECPAEDESFWICPEDDTYECPHCGMAVMVEAGEAEHEDVPTVKCPVSANLISLTGGDGEYACPDCRRTIDVDGGSATHEYVQARPAARTRRPTRINRSKPTAARSYK